MSPAHLDFSSEITWPDCCGQAGCINEAQGDGNSMAGQHVTRLMTEVIALSMCTMHARKRRLTWFQHLNLQTLRAGKLDLQAWLNVAVRPPITLSEIVFIQMA